MKQFLKTKSSHVINDVESPLTENQKTLWLAHQINEKSGLYHELLSIQIKGALDVQQLQKALQYIINIKNYLNCILIHYNVEVLRCR